MKPEIFTIVKGSVFIILVIAIIGCGQEEQVNNSIITYRLKWLYNTSVAGDLYAKTNGFFMEEGLSVTIKEGGPERDAIKELEMGYAHFGVASSDQVIRAVSKGSPIVVILQLFQINPLQWIYRKDQHLINQPFDLKGKIIGVTFGGNDETILKALFSKYSIKDDEVSLYSVRYDYTPFYQSQVDLWPVYRNAQGIIIQEKLKTANEPVCFFDPDKFQIRFVANSVITTQKMLKTRSAIVKKFVTALSKGWQEALKIENKADAIKTIQQFDKDTPLNLIEKQLETTRMLMISGKSIEFGKINTEDWIQTEKILLEQKLIPKPVNIERNLKPFSQF